MQEEIWKDVVGFEGTYQVSNLGNVKSFHLNKERLLKHSFDNDGYPMVGLSKAPKKATRKIHRLVAQSFIPNPHNKPCINHINGIKTDNRLENLEWCTYSENIQHAMKTGLYKNVIGTNNYLSRLTETDIMFIRTCGLSNKYLREKYNVTKSCICRIRARISYRSIL